MLFSLGLCTKKAELRLETGTGSSATGSHYEDLWLSLAMVESCLCKVVILVGSTRQELLC